MKIVRSVLLMGILLTGLSAPAAAQSTRGISPRTLVSNLFKQHKRKSPFFQTRSRALLDKYFQRQLASRIWQEARASRGDVGKLDADPLYNAQDIEIRDFALQERIVGTTSAEVTATFRNFGEQHKVLFRLVPERMGWKIADIGYDDGSSLLGWLGFDGASNEGTQPVKVYLIALDDNGRNGKKIGCGDSLVPVARNIRQTAAPLTAALNELLSMPAEANGTPKLENFWKGRNLKLKSASIVNNTATIRISGEVFVAGICDMPRIESQIEETARQFPNVKRVRVFLGNQTLRNAIR